MNLKTFTNIKGSVDLINTAGGSDTNSIFIHNKIYDAMKTMIAEKETKEAMTEQVERIVYNYEIDTKDIEKKAVAMMKELGFKN